MQTVEVRMLGEDGVGGRLAWFVFEPITFTLALRTDEVTDSRDRVMESDR